MGCDGTLRGGMGCHWPVGSDIIWSDGMGWDTGICVIECHVMGWGGI